MSSKKDKDSKKKKKGVSFETKKVSIANLPPHSGGTAEKRSPRFVFPEDSIPTPKLSNIADIIHPITTTFSPATISSTGPPTPKSVTITPPKLGQGTKSSSSSSLFGFVRRAPSDGAIAGSEERVVRNPVYNYHIRPREVRNPLKRNDVIQATNSRLPYSPSLPDSLSTQSLYWDPADADGLESMLTDFDNTETSHSPKHIIVGTPKKLFTSLASLARTPSMDSFPLAKSGRAASEQDLENDAYLYMRIMKAYREKKIDVAKYPNILELDVARQMWKAIPKHRLTNLSSLHDVCCIVGPGKEEKALPFSNMACCQTISTYPFIEQEKKRSGDPICDYFCLSLLDRAAILTIADGCNWGAGPQEAARKASSSFTAFLAASLPELKHTRQAARVILRAFAVAHHSILEGKEDLFRCGTTTLLGGIVLPLLACAHDSPPSASESDGNTSDSTPRPKPKRGSVIGNLFKDETSSIGGWCFVFGSVGDCKAFLWSPRKKTATDMTRSNRISLDARDCGGRLGPHLDEGKPDLRNLEVFCHPCEEDDIIIIVSDGVHDNLDPHHLGIKPRELGMEYDEWAQCSPAEAQNAKTIYRENLLAELIQRSVDDCGDHSLSSTSPSSILRRTPTPYLITRALMDHCFLTTRPSRHFMETKPGDILPHDYGSFPGKMDHTTCVAVKVGVFDKKSSRSERT